MPRLTAISSEHAAGKAKDLLDGVQATLGMIPNLMRTMANSPAVLEAYLNFKGALAMGSLPATLREQIALAVAEVNGCDYCLAAHAAVGTLVGLSHQDILDSRQGTSPDRKVEAALRFARMLVQQRGRVGDEDLARLRKMGYGDDEISEIVAHVALNVFSNYFTLVADTVVDFPEVSQSSRRDVGPAGIVYRVDLRKDSEAVKPFQRRLT